MRILFVNPYSGLAGDMLTAALLDAGADCPAFWETLTSLPIPDEWSARLEPVMKTGIAAKRFVVDLPHTDAHHAHDHDHSHHHHHHDHDHSHSHSHDHHHKSKIENRKSKISHHHGHAHGRHLAEIERIIADSALPERAKVLAVTAFRRLAEAEAAVHGTTPDKVHFHEVGAVDAIVDVCGACLAFTLLEIDEVVCAPIALGGGTVHCEHGTMPVPVPAVTRLLAGIPTHTGPVDKELTTPTGAALIVAFCSDFSGRVSGVAGKTGYGGGTREFHNHANVLPVTLYESAESANDDSVTVLSCTIDDATGEDIGALINTLMAAGALDVSVTPCLMKKGRPGHAVEALCTHVDADRLGKTLIRHSSTFGIRRRQEARMVLNRFFTEVDTAFGVIRAKIGVFSGQEEVIQVAPEFEDCLSASRTHGVSPATVRRAALAAWHETQQKETK